MALALLFCDVPFAIAAGDALAERWRSQGVAAIVPGYEWAREALAQRPETSRASVSPWSAAMLRRLGRNASLELRFEGTASSFARLQTAAAGGGDHNPVLLRSQAPPVGGGWIDSSVSFGLGAGERLDAGAILVYQRFAAWELGHLPPSGPILGAAAGRGVDRGVEERAYGYGVRLDYRLELSAGSELAVQTQSRVDMEPFKTFRGVYSDAGDFDLPAFVGLGLRSRLGPGIELMARVQRVFFSQVRPFTSAALPVRLLALLGDASAPRFAWDDLDIYSAELRIQPSVQDHVALTVSSRQVPLPSAGILREALADEAPSYQVSLAYQRELGPWGVLSARAAYAPRQGFLALGPFHDRGDPARRQREFDLAWIVGF